MVLLTMTAPMKEALEHLRSNSNSNKIFATNENDPSLFAPAIGKPISHGQVMDISTQMKELGLSPCHLDVLLRGSGVYNPPPAPKPEQTSEYKVLMARLRREEEARAYERITNDTAVETFSSRLPTSSAAHAFSSTTAYIPDTETDEMTYVDVDRQVMLIFNVLISVFACGAAIWMVGKWWSTPARLALSMSGSLLVGVAEVVVYTGYIRRLGQAKGKEKAVKEVKEIIKTWVVGGGEHLETQLVASTEKEDTGVRERRRKKERI